MRLAARLRGSAAPQANAAEAAAGALGPRLRGLAEGLRAEAAMQLADGDPNRAGEIARTMRLAPRADAAGFLLTVPAEDAWRREFGSSAQAPRPFLREAIAALRRVAGGGGGGAAGRTLRLRAKARLQRGGR